MKQLLLPLALLMLAGCGHRGPLVRIPDENAIPRDELRALRRAQGQASEQALTPPPQAQPRRVDDVQIRREERVDDPFNLPPKE